MTFSLDVSNFIKLATGNEDIVLRKIALELFSRVIKKTPVKTGRARGNWQVGIGMAPSLSTNDRDKIGSATTSKGNSVLNKAHFGDKIFLVNNLPYIWKLENGSSKRQAPQGMVKITLREFRNIVRNA